MKRIVKYCPPEYSLLNGCRTVRLGTFEYYRNMEQKNQIRDPLEGRDTVRVGNMQMETASPEAKQAVSSFMADIPYVHLIDIDLNRTFPNSYLFCCSILSKRNLAEHASRFGDDYTAYYEIKDVNVFIQRLVHMILSNIKIDHFSDDSQKELKKLAIGDSGIVVTPVAHKVLYVPEKVSNIKDGEILPFQEEKLANLEKAHKGLSIIFSKVKSYEKEQEFRIVFLIANPRIGVLGMREDPVDFPILPVDEVPSELDLKNSL